MKILYIFPNYNSHYRAALSFCKLLREWHSFVSRVDQADVVVLHCEPHEYASMYRSYRLTNKYVVACAVWEADDLPGSYQSAMQYVDEVWVPSQYCKAAFQRYHARVHVVPYVVDDPVAISDDDRAAIRQTIEYDERLLYYLTITKVWDKRKNVQLLIDAFAGLAGDMPNARLIVKACDRDEVAQFSDPRTMVINANLTDASIAALYECADVYVSAHHAEGWGLTMADALQFQKPTIATGYSGNLEFMDENNSYLLAFEEDYIRDEDVFGLFTQRMRWAYPSRKDLEEKLLTLYRVGDDSTVLDAVQAKLRAAADIQRFSPPAVGRLLRSRLEQSEGAVRRREVRPPTSVL
jgi:glycosyltransferase involved in cell wall biosynthesis